MRTLGMMRAPPILAVLAATTLFGAWGGVAHAKRPGPGGGYVFTGHWAGYTTNPKHGEGGKRNTLEGDLKGQNKRFSGAMRHTSAYEPFETITINMKGTVKPGDAILVKGKSSALRRLTLTGHLDRASNTIAGTVSGVNNDGSPLNSSFSLTKQ